MRNIGRNSLPQSPERIQVNYRMEDGGRTTALMGSVEDSYEAHLILSHGKQSNFTKSWLSWDRIVSIHALKEKVE